MAKGSGAIPHRARQGGTVMRFDAGAMTGGRVICKKTRAGILDVVLQKLKAAGAQITAVPISLN